MDLWNLTVTFILILKAVGLLWKEATVKVEKMFYRLISGTLLFNIKERGHLKQYNCNRL